MTGEAVTSTQRGGGMPMRGRKRVEDFTVLGQEPGIAKGAEKGSMAVVEANPAVSPMGA
jgi:hypothetical protein